MDARVVRICIAPVKALHVFERDEVELTRAGVVGDRRFWLVDRDRRLVNGKAPSRAHARAAGVGRGLRGGSRSRSPTARRGGRGRAGRAVRGRPVRHAASVAARAGAVAGGAVRVRGRAGHAALVGGRRAGPRQRPRWLGVADLARLARADACRGRCGRAGGRPPLPDAVRDRRGRGARGGHLARQSGRDRRRCDRPAR